MLILKSVHDYSIFLAKKYDESYSNNFERFTLNSYSYVNSQANMNHVGK